jgi:hypothetical protein
VGISNKWEQKLFTRSMSHKIKSTIRKFLFQSKDKFS